jgi:hypothetical protein
MSADRLGLDELMIINPGAGKGTVFLGDDGVLYRVRRLAGAAPARGSQTGSSPAVLLGDDGRIYRVERCGCRPGPSKRS